MSQFMKAIFVLLSLISGQAFAGEFDLFTADYLKKVVSGDTAAIPMSRDFAKQLEEDKIEFKVCEGKSCSVRMRENPVLRKQEPRSTLWEVRFDVYLEGKRSVRRSGCYLIVKTERGLTFDDYIYECYGK